MGAIADEFCPMDRLRTQPLALDEGSMITTILSWVAMPLVRYAGIALIGLVFTAYMRHTAAAPWKNQVAELKQVIADRERIIKDHGSLLETHEAEAEKLKIEIEGILHASKDDPSACVLSTAQLNHLHRIAGGG
jgi:hypothetical protein